MRVLEELNCKPFNRFLVRTDQSASPILPEILLSTVSIHGKLHDVILLCVNIFIQKYKKGKYKNVAVM